MSLIKNQVLTYKNKNIAVAIIAHNALFVTVRANHPYDKGEIQFSIPINELT
jgi:hypothetical protein